MTPEQKLTRNIQLMLTGMAHAGLPVWSVKLHGSIYQRAGLPDQLVVVAGRACFFEVKAPKGVVRAIQKHTLEMLRKVGAVAEVVRSVEEVRGMVEGVLRTQKWTA